MSYTVEDVQADGTVKEKETPSGKSLGNGEVIMTPGQMASLFKPTVTVPFTHPEDDSTKIIFLGKRFDPLTATLTDDIAVIRSLVRLQMIADLDAKKAASMSEADFAELLDASKVIDDMKYNKFYKRLVVSYCLIDPQMTHEQIEFSITEEMVDELYNRFTGGETKSGNDPVDAFHTEDK